MNLYELTDLQRKKYDAYVRLRTSGVQRINITTQLAKEFGITRGAVDRFLKNKKIKPLVEAYENRVEALDEQETFEKEQPNIASIGYILNDLTEQAVAAKEDGELRLKVTKTIIDVRQKFKADTEDYIESIQNMSSSELLRGAIEAMKALLGNERTKKALTEAMTETLGDKFCTT